MRDQALAFARGHRFGERRLGSAGEYNGLFLLVWLAGSVVGETRARPPDG
jgi:hypothetical protein